MAIKKSIHMIVLGALLVVMLGSALSAGSVSAKVSRPVTAQAASVNDGSPQTVMSGPYGGTVSDLKMDPLTPTTLYAATNYGVFKSTNNGDSWFLTGLSGVTVYALAIDPVHPLNVYAGTRGEGFYRSADGGATWTSSVLALNQKNIIVYTLAVDPSNSAILYAGGRAANLDETTALNTDQWGGGAFKSTDGGKTWAAINNNMPEGWVYTLVVDPKTPTTLYAGNHTQGIFKSIDGGSTWVPKSNGLVTTSTDPDNKKIRSLSINPWSPNTLIAGVWGRGAVFITSNGGDNWTYDGKGIYNGQVRTVAIDPMYPDNYFYFAGRNAGGTYKNTTNAISNWSTFPIQAQGPWDYFSTVNAIAINPNNDGILFMAFSGGGILRSLDGGNHWQTANQGLAATSVTAIVPDPFNPSTVYAATDGSGVFKSTDQGLTWSTYPWARPWDWGVGLAADPATPGKLYLATENYGLGVSLDGGVSWSAINAGLPTAPVAAAPALSPTSPAYPDEETGQAPQAAVATPVISAVVVAPTSPAHTLYAGTWGHGVYKSVNGGSSWTMVDGSTGQVTDIAVYPNDPQSLLASTANLGIIQITNGGANHTILNNTNGLPASLDILSVLINPTTPKTLYAGTPTGIYTSANNGATWSLFGLPTEVVNALAIDPLNQATFYAGTQMDGLLRTNDNGATWASTGIPAGEVDVLTMDPGSRLHLYAGVNGGGVINVNYSMMILSLFIRVITPTPPPAP